MNITLRAAVTSDQPMLVPLMRAYYVEDGLSFAALNIAALERLLREPQWGRVWLIEDRTVPLGYLAICLGYSLELGGNDAYIDELYLRPEFRGRGIARKNGISEVTSFPSMCSL
jgi:GNAT superfamily N-acetyltransferase